MAIQLNHTIVWCRDNVRSAAFLTELFGLPGATTFGPFMVVEMDNALSLDFHSTEDDIQPQHYAFLVGDEDFDAIYGRITAKGLDHWEDPACSTPGVNTHDGGRGTYFLDPDHHLLEILTVPYGG
jgi:catechol 2,3-dioxygenase-like lactoylglutathione lyase family enzyme